MLKNNMTVGMAVQWNRRGIGELRVGRVVKLNPKRALVSVAGEVGNWTVPYAMLTPANPEDARAPMPPTPVTKPTLKVGTRILFGKPKGEKLYGLITKVNGKTYGILEDEEDEFGIRKEWRVSHVLVTAV